MAFLAPVVSGLGSAASAVGSAVGSAASAVGSAAGTIGSGMLSGASGGAMGSSSGLLGSLSSGVGGMLMGEATKAQNYNPPRNSMAGYNAPPVQAGQPKPPMQQANSLEAMLAQYNDPRFRRY